MIPKSQIEYFRGDVRNCLKNKIEPYWTEEELSEKQKQVIKEEEKCLKTKIKM